MTDRLPSYIVRAHEDALTRGDDGYIDPDTSLFVMTADALRARGACCGSGCRHCPYTAEEQRVAGRPVGRKALR